MSNTLMDSPEALGHALCRLLPEMSHGFVIRTCSGGEIQISADDSLSFVKAMNLFLTKKVMQLQKDSYRIAAPEKSGNSSAISEVNP